MKIGLSVVPAIALLAVALHSCKDDPVTTPPPGNGRDTSMLMPLAAGNEWISRHPGATPSPFDTLRILRDTSINGEKWFIASTGIFYTNRTDGLYTWNAARSRAERDVKFPVAVGDTIIDRGWFVSFDNNSGAIVDSTHNYVIVAATNMPVTVPAGTFTCIKAQVYYYTVGAGHEPALNTANEFIYYAPGVGKVKEEVLQASTSGGTYVTLMELMSVSVK